MRRPLINLMFVAAFLATVSRGVFEEYGSKTLGYLVQTVMWTIFLLVLQRDRTRLGTRTPTVFLYAFVVLALLSSILTDVIFNYPSAYLYTAVMMVLAGSLYLCGGFRYPAARDFNFPLWLAVIGILLVVVACGQQLEIGAFTLPGSDSASLDGTIRPASLTGSYLHYPLVISIFPFIFGQLFLSSRKLLYLFLSLFFVGAVIISYSRSGEMILGLGALVFFIVSARATTRVSVLFWGGLALVVVAWTVPKNAYLERALSAVNAQGTGNVTRIERWHSGVDMWLSSPWLVGTHTGFVTNIIKNLGTVHTGVVESGLIQQVVSFGLLGAFCFYALLLLPRQLVDRRFALLRAGYLGAVLESFVYQSIEVFPFVVTLCVVPLVAQYCEGRDRPAAGPDVEPSLTRPAGSPVAEARTHRQVLPTR